MSHRLQRRRRLLLILLGAAAVFAVAIALLPLALSARGERVGWHLARDWRVAAWSSQAEEWDEPLPGQPFPQVYQLRAQQFGPIVMETRRRVRGKSRRGGSATD